MRDLVRSTVTTGIAIATAGALAVAPAVLPTEPHAPAVMTDVRLSAATATMPASPPLGALVGQFLVNQVEDCSLICPFIIQLAIQVPVNFAIIPFTFIGELQSGTPLLQAIALTDATVSGAANAALTGIIDNDLTGALPRAQNSLEVALIGLIDIATTAVTQPANLLQAIIDARTNFFVALTQSPGQPVPPVHNALEAGVVRVIEIVSSLTFQAPERLLLGVTQAADAFFRTLGNTGNLAAALGAVGSSVSATVSDSVAFIQHAFTEPIPITPAAATRGATSTTTGTAATGMATATGATNTTTATGATKIPTTNTTTATGATNMPTTARTHTLDNMQPVTIATQVR
ncbi:MAG: hypothetical protein JOZ49_22850, partial [Mycolicibacterium sp.]|nr:hypothetical protein [Mycolicibacterium sp.]